MRIFKRGSIYHYEFELGGKRHRASTRCSNRRAAEDIATAARMKLIKVEAGIESSKSVVPTLTEFRKQFLDWMETNCENGKTRTYYQINFDNLLRCDKLAGLRLDRIDEPVVEEFKTWALRTETTKGRKIGKSTVNRYLACLKKALRYATRKLRIVDRVPVIEMFSGEKPREYTFSDQEYSRWLETSPEPLRSMSVLARHSGICRGEMLALERDCVTLFDKPGPGGSYGSIDVKRGLKRECRRRTLQMNGAMRDVIASLLRKSKCQYVFTSPRDPGLPLSPEVLVSQLRRLKSKFHFHKHAGLHSLRHTFITRASELIDPYRLQRIAGHSDIKTTLRYINHEKHALESAFTLLFARDSAQEPTQRIVSSDARP